MLKINYIKKLNKLFMKFKLNDKEYEMHYSFRMMMMYEQIQQKSFNFNNVTMEDIVILMYTAVMSTLQYCKSNDTIKYDDFLNWIDDNGGEKLLVEFTNWYVDKITAQNDLMPEKKDEDKPNQFNQDPNF